MFFDFYAKQNGFDPLVPEHWYKVKAEKLLKYKVFTSFFSSSYPLLIFSLLLFSPLFPLFCLSFYFQGASRINHITRGFQEALMSSYPDIGIDKSKFTIKPRMKRREGGEGGRKGRGRGETERRRGGRGSYLTTSLGNYWVDPANQKKFFIKFARRWSFNPLIPSHWYSVKPMKLLSFSV